MNSKIGAKGTALSSSNFKVWSYRDGKCAHLELKDGIKVKFEIKELSEKEKTRHGTVVEFTPAQEVYNLEPVSIKWDEVKKMCRDWSFLTVGVSFELTNHMTNEKIVYCSKNGLLDLMKEEGGRAIHKTPLHIEVKEGAIQAEIVMEWTTARGEEWHVFTNGLENSAGGTSLTGIKTALTNYFKKKIKGNDNTDLYRKGLYYAVSCKLPNVSFSDQTKTRVNSPELRGICQRATTKMLEEFEQRHSDEFEKVLDVLSKEMRAEIAAERARKQVLEATKDIEKNQKRKVFASDKLKDAEYLGQDSVLLLVEGLSAGASIAMARDTKKYGILALRGKPIGAFTNPDEKFYQNEEIKLLLSAMNIVPGKYDSKKLRYGKIGITADEDSDGKAIGLLIMCVLYKVAPQFIEEGRLCWMRSPLYILKNKGKETYFYSDEELNKVRPKLVGELQRNKGLGSLSAEQAHNSMFTPEFQRLDVLRPDEKSLPLLQQLMGDNSQPKHDFLFDRLDFSVILE